MCNNVCCCFLRYLRLILFSINLQQLSKKKCTIVNNNLSIQSGFIKKTDEKIRTIFKKISCWYYCCIRTISSFCSINHSQGSMCHCVSVISCCAYRLYKANRIFNHFFDSRQQFQYKHLFF